MFSENKIEKIKINCSVNDITNFKSMKLICKVNLERFKMLMNVNLCVHIGSLREPQIKHYWMKTKQVNVSLLVKFFVGNHLIVMTRCKCIWIMSQMNRGQLKQGLIWWSNFSSVARLGPRTTLLPNYQLSMICYIVTSTHMMS